MVKRGVLKVSKAWKLAAALAFAAALAGTSVWWGLSRQGEFEWVAQRESSLQAIYASDHVRNRCLLLARFEKMECAVKSRDEHRAYDTNEQGLVAQKTSALWTMIMGCAAIFGMVVSAVGVYLVWTTFAETRRANEIASDTAKRQLRAYCNVCDIAAEGISLGKEPEFIVTAINSGQTPARTLRFDTECLIVANPPPADLYKPDVTNHAEVTVGASKVAMSRVTLGHKLTQPEWEDIQIGKVLLIVRAYGEYLDIFNERQSFQIGAFVAGLPNSVVVKPILGSDFAT